MCGGLGCNVGTVIFSFYRGGSPGPPSSLGQEGWAESAQWLWLAHQARLPMGNPVSVGPLFTAGERRWWRVCFPSFAAPAPVSTCPWLSDLLCHSGLCLRFPLEQRRRHQPQGLLSAPLGTQGGQCPEGKQFIPRDVYGHQVLLGAGRGWELLQVTPLPAGKRFSVMTQLEWGFRSDPISAALPPGAHPFLPS